MDIQYFAREMIKIHTSQQQNVLEQIKRMSRWVQEASEQMTAVSEIPHSFLSPTDKNNSETCSSIRNFPTDEIILLK